MKRGRLFAKIIYYAFTFLFGIVLAIGLPSYYATFDVPTRYIGECMQQGRFLEAMAITAPCFDTDACIFHDGDDFAVRIYEGVVNLDKKANEEDDQSPTVTLLYKSFIGYVYAPAYETFSQGDNRTAVQVTQVDGIVRTIPLPDYDSDGNGTFDGISTVTQNGYIVLDLNTDKVSSIDRMALIDCNGAVYWESEPDLGLRFDDEFFSCFAEIDEYNNLVRAYPTQTDKTSVESSMKTLFDTFRSRVLAHEGYYFANDSELYVSVQREVRKAADKKAVPIIIVYFVGIYIVGDFLLGNFYIVKFFRWFLFKVCKIPHKEKKGPKKEEVFGHDYYSMVTVSLDVSQVPEFNGSVEIRYTNTDSEARFILLKADNYTATQRIKAGVYVNPYIDINRAYAPIDLPDNLEVEGYRVDKIVTITRVARPEQELDDAEQSEQVSRECDDAPTQQQASDEAHTDPAVQAEEQTADPDQSEK